MLYYECYCYKPPGSKPTLFHSHTKIEAYTALEQGTVIISVGASGTPYNLRQNSVAKVFKHVSPIIVTPYILNGMNPQLSGLVYSSDGTTPVDLPKRDTNNNILQPYQPYKVH